MTEVLCPVVVGRAAEARVLESALEAAMGARGGCVAVTGEAGIGKSRLVRELVRLASERHVPVVGGRALPSSASTAYRPVTEALLQLLRGKPLPDDPSLGPWLAHLGAILPGIVPAGAPGEPGQGTSADAVRGEAVLQLLRRVKPGGLVVTVEDLHWADPDTVALLEYLSDNASDLPLLFVVTLRNDPPSPAADMVRRQRGRPGVVHVPLGRLSEGDVADMVAACRPDADAETRSRIARASEGVPLLVEELLASPGIPQSIADTVRARLAEFSDDERKALETAAVMGRHFDWEILPAATGVDSATVSRALAGAVDRVLMSADDDGFRFRHALTRDAVLASMLPPRVREAAGGALAAIDAAHPYLEGRWREVAADLAARAGDRARAGRLLAEAGRDSVRLGALATAVDTLRRAIELLGVGRDRDETDLALLEALALAGRVEEAAAAAVGLIERLGDDPTTTATRTEAHLRLTHAAVAAARWPLARRHLAAAVALGDDSPDPGLRPRAKVLEADLALSVGDLEQARQAAEEVLAMEGAGPAARCHAHEIVGRTLRMRDLAGAAEAFEAALSLAERHDLPVWRMRALHELGTVDIFERVEVGRLLEARHLGEQMGALGTVAVLDLQLAAAYTGRWDLDAVEAHAASALDLARRLGLTLVAAKALALMAGAASMRGDRDATERLAAQAAATDGSDPSLPAFGRASVGMALFMAGDPEAALAPFGDGVGALSRLPNAEPISIRALWPLVLAGRGDRRAAASLEVARRAGVDAFAVNAGMTGFADAVLHGQAGRPERADAIVAGLAASFVGCETWADLSRFIAAPRAIADGWGEPVRWLESAGRRFAGLGLQRLSARCAELLGAVSSNPWAALGVTVREADVLRLVMDGLANKEIAAALGLSPRTVEKHVESLLRKAGARSRTELAATARHAGGSGPAT